MRLTDDDIEEQIDKAMEEHKAEVDFINEIPDFEQQGYAAAPLLCKITGIAPVQLALTVLMDLGKPGKQCDLIRDQGILRWCREQQYKQDRGQDPLYGMTLGDEK